MHGRPYYKYLTRAGNITFSCTPPPAFENRFHPSIAMYYKPRLGFVYSGGLRHAVQNLSVETADIFLILMSRVAELRDPATGIAGITLEEMARTRGVHLRHGSTHALYEVFRREVLRLADMRLTMSWRDYATGGTVTFGKDRPDRLLDILDVEYRRTGKTWSSFRFRCGQALSHFLDPAGLFWLGHYSRSLLQLSPYHEAFTKKLGTYWTLIGTVAERKGSLPRATPRTILDFCGESVNRQHPGQTVDAFIESHQKLADLGILESIPTLEPVMRIRGYFRDWLDSPLTVRLSENLRWLSSGRKTRPPAVRTQRKLSLPDHDTARIPKTVEELTANPTLIKRLRADHYLRQDELAHALGVTRQTLSNYERGKNPLPTDTALKIIHIWQRKVREKT
jgi:DNA-binding XRE family transcriptional regulator